MSEEFEGSSKRNIVLIVVLVAAVGLTVWRFAGSGNARPGENDRYFYDVGTGQLFPSDGRQLPAIKSPTGAEGVLAHVYSCSSCADASSRKVAYLEKYSDEGKAFLDQQRTATEPNPGARAPAQSHVVAGPSQTPQWVDYDSEEARTLMNLQSHCPEGKATLCLPGK